MKTCLIHQPGGLGDILWIQPIINNIINHGYRIYFPVVEIYYEMLKSGIKKDNLVWLKETDDYPLKHLYGKSIIHNSECELYLPISFANYFLNGCSNMMSKYYFTKTPISNWHDSFDIELDIEKQNKVFEIYNINPKEPYCLVNMAYGTPPSHKTRSIVIQNNIKKINLSIDVNAKYNISIFDCISLIENATEIHTVETSVCHLVDKYAKTKKLFMYEKRLEHEPNTYYTGDNRVYRKPNWIYNSQ